MAVAAITRFPPSARSAVDNPNPADRLAGNHPKMQIVPEGGAPFVVPYAPRDSVVDGVAPVWQSVDRGGRDPLLLRAGGSLLTMQFELIVAYPDWNTSVEPILAQLRALAESGDRMMVKLDAVAGSVTWRLTGFTQTTIARQHGTNQPTRATCSLTFTQASDPVAAAGPVSGGAGAAGSSGGAAAAKRPAFYVVKKGDTLQSIAKHFYGVTAAWRDIADLNKIRDPKTVKVGDKLRLPKTVTVWVPGGGSSGTGTKPFTQVVTDGA